MTTLSQFIELEENLSLSFHSTPGFKDSKREQLNSHEDVMQENNISSANLSNSNIKIWSQQQQAKDTKLFSNINSTKYDRTEELNYNIFNKDHNAQSKQNKGCTPVSLLEKLRDFKHEKENRLPNSSLRQPISFTSRSRFSLISLKNPAFKLFEDIKRQRITTLTRNGLGWHDKALYEDKGLGQFYRIPDDNSIADYENQSNKSNTEIKSHTQYSQIMTKGKPQDTSIVSKIFKKTKNNKISLSSNTIIDQIIAQSSILEEEQDKQLFYKSLKQVDEQILKESMKVDAEIQTQEGLKVIPDCLTANFEKLSFEQLSNKIIKHLELLEVINNSLLAENNNNAEIKQFANQREERQNIVENDKKLRIGKNSSKDSSTLLISQEFQKNKENQSKSSHVDESKYFRLSQSQFVMTPAEKLKLLQRFNKQQNEMFKKLFQSMVSCQSAESSRIFKVFKSRQKNQDRVFQSQICRKAQLQFSQSQTSQKIGAKESDINFQPPKGQQAEEMTFLKKTYEDIISVDPSKFMHTSSEEKSQNLINDSQFGKLQELMRDREMKKSIFGSNQENSSFNSESFLTVVDSEITKKFQKFIPETLKKDETQ